MNRTKEAKLVLAIMCVFSIILIGSWSAWAGDEHHHGAMQMSGDHHEAMHMNGKVTLSGEVVDLHCFMSHPENGQGPDHAKCATSCINKGIAAGFLADNQLYLLLSKDHNSPKDQVADLAGKPVVVTGTLFEHNGMKSIQIETISEKKSMSMNDHMSN